MSSVLQTRGLRCAFGAVVAADNVNVAVKAGETIGVIGANGAGKTTFVNMVTGHLKPDSGEIRYRGCDIIGMSTRAITRLGLRRSFQVPQLFAEMSVLDNVLIALQLARAAPRGWFARLRTRDSVAESLAVLERFGIASQSRQRAGRLPHGTRKLLDIAMATVGDPRLVLLDEPTSGVSSEEKFQFMDALMRALDRRGATVLFIEHDMDIVERYGERVVAFYEGRVIADGPPAETLADPDVQRHIVGGPRLGSPPGPSVA